MSKKLDSILAQVPPLFTSIEFTGALKNMGIQISMDGKGRWMDNVFIERMWRSLKYECVYIQVFENGSALKQGLRNWFVYYNNDRQGNRIKIVALYGLK